MAWQIDHGILPFWRMESRSATDSLPFNQHCFIRKDHRCGKLFGASKSCFIACPTNDELEPILELMSEKLSKVGVEPIIAVKERAYGQDIFCTKICGKIIESRFCVVILDDTIEAGKNIPNPNVYYEYGLMTSLRKHIIPLQKEDLTLAFNIQSYDTIKYTPRNLAGELDRAIKDALRITEAKEKEEKKTSIPEKTLLRKLELAGLDLRGDGWFLSDAIVDTHFKGFGQYDKGFYLYLGKIDDESEFQDHLEDLGVVLYRTEKMAEEQEAMLSTAEKRKAELDAERQEDEEARASHQYLRSPTRRVSLDRELESANNDIVDAKSKLDLMSTMYVGFVASPAINTDHFVSEAEALIAPHTRYKLVCSRNGVIAFGDIEIVLSGPASRYREEPNEPDARDRLWPRVIRTREIHLPDH